MQDRAAIIRRGPPCRRCCEAAPACFPPSAVGARRLLGAAPVGWALPGAPAAPQPQQAPWPSPALQAAPHEVRGSPASGRAQLSLDSTHPWCCPVTHRTPQGGWDFLPLLGSLCPMAQGLLLPSFPPSCPGGIGLHWVGGEMPPSRLRCPPQPWGCALLHCQLCALWWLHEGHLPANQALVRPNAHGVRGERACEQQPLPHGA